MLTNARSGPWLRALALASLRFRQRPTARRPSPLVRWVEVLRQQTFTS